MVMVQNIRGAMIGPPIKDIPIISYPPHVHVTAPAQFDWRNVDGHDWMTPVKTQRHGACWAHSAVGVVEAAFNIHGDNPNLDFNLSEHHAVSACCRDCGDYSGGYPDKGLEFIQENGICDNPCFPYSIVATCSPCDGWEANAYRIKGFVYIEPSKANFQAALQEYGPMCVVLLVDSDWYYYDDAGNYQRHFEPRLDVDDANHAVVLVGWDDSDGCWFVKNSRGVDVGEDGYMRVKYGNLEKYNYAYAVTGVTIGESGDVGVGGWISPSAVIDVSSQFGEHKPSNAIDNDRGTKWLSSPGGLQSITFDLGDQVMIDSIRAIDYYGNVPDIYISNNASNWTLVGSIRMERDVYGVAEFTAVSARYIKLERPSGTGYFSCTEMQVFAPTGTGWFKPKFAVSSSDYDSDHLAENAIDGFFGEGFDCWFSGNEVPRWIRFDLGLEKTFDAVRIVSPSDPLPMTVVVEVSSDDISWIPVTSDVVINDSYTEMEVAITQSTARYVRLNVVDTNGVGGCCEFDVHVVDDTVANIEVVSFTVTPQTCQTPCDTVVMITWKNVGTASVTFTPGYTIDGVLYSSSPITLIPIQQGLLRETIHGLTVGSYEICPVPN